MIAYAAVVVACLLTLILLPFVGLLTAVLVAAVRARLEPRGTATLDLNDPELPRLLLVIPAHDEEAMISTTVRSCLAARYPRDRFTVHVIADNCNDLTADRAREAGAIVYERSHPTLRSKGHALEEFFTIVADAKPATGSYDAAVLVDADTEVDPDALGWFAAALRRGDDWVQGYYTVANADATWRTRLMTYAFSLINGAWMLGLDRLGLGVGLKGNGMMFSRRGLLRFPWRAHGLVEDMEFAWMLRLAGERVRFEPHAIVRGEMVSQGGKAAESQRIRWEAGRAELRSRFRPQILDAARLGVMASLGYLLDLQFPPLGTLVVLATTSTLVAGLVALISQGIAERIASVVTIVDATMLAAIFLYVGCPFYVMRLPVRYASSLIAVPGYLIWKSIRVIGRSPVAWVRTPRESSRQANTDPLPQNSFPTDRN